MKQQTVGGALSEWLALHSLGRRPTTQKFNKEVEAMIRRSWRDLDQPVCSITTDDVTSCAEKFAHYCPSRWNAAVSALQWMTPAASGLERRELRGKDRLVLSQLQFDALLTECDKLPRSRAGLIVRFLAHSGMRITEARGLKWQDVSDDRIVVPGRLTKNGRPRVIPFVNGVADVLARLKPITGGDYVLPQEGIRRGLCKACERAGLPKLSHHDFRHHFATRCLQSGVDVPTVARWLGHSDGGALLGKRYFHLVDEHSRRMAARVVI